MIGRIAGLVAWVCLRALVMAACAVAGAVLAVIADRPFAPRSAPDWGFGRLGVELLAGGAAGLVAGLILAARLGRRRWDGPDRVLQCLPAIALFALLMAAMAMEGRP